MGIGKENDHPSDAIRVYLSGAASTGSDGVWTALAFDATSSLVATSGGLSLSAGSIAVARGFNGCLMSKIQFDATGVVGLTGILARLVIVRGGSDIELMRAPAGIAGDQTVAVLDDMPSFQVGDALRVDVMSVGAASVLLVTGDGKTFLVLRAI